MRSPRSRSEPDRLGRLCRPGAHALTNNPAGGSQITAGRCHPVSDGGRQPGAEIQLGWKRVRLESELAHQSRDRVVSEKQYLVAVLAQSDRCADERGQITACTGRGDEEESAHVVRLLSRSGMSAGGADHAQLLASPAHELHDLVDPLGVAAQDADDELFGLEVWI